MRQSLEKVCRFFFIYLSVYQDGFIDMKKNVIGCKRGNENKLKVNSYVKFIVNSTKFLTV